MKKIKTMIDKLIYAEEWNDYHKAVINSEIPSCIMKLGSTETKCIVEFFKNKDINIKDLWLTPGVFCDSEQSYSDYCEAYVQAIKTCDYIHLWHTFCFKANIKIE